MSSTNAVVPEKTQAAIQTATAANTNEASFVKVFSPVTAASRLDRAELHKSRAARLLQGGALTFVSALGFENASHLVSDPRATLQIGKATLHLNACRCPICSGMHGEPSAIERANGEGVDPRNLRHTVLFLQNGKIVAVSATCVPKWLFPLFRKNPAAVTNMQEMLTAYGLKSLGK